MRPRSVLPLLPSGSSGSGFGDAPPSAVPRYRRCHDAGAGAQVRARLVFFFSSRRRHTRCSRDWSSDVCSSDLVERAARTLRYRDLVLVALMTTEDEPFPDNWIYLHDPETRAGRVQNYGAWSADRSEERRVGKSVDLGGRRIIKKKKGKKIVQ